MARLIDSIDQRTQLAGQNRLELLLFRLNDDQLYGINVFKVREAIPCPVLTHLPFAHPVVCGSAKIRDTPMSLIDLSLAIGCSPLQNPPDSLVIVTEYNRKVQGFLVRQVERIINTDWTSMLPPPPALGQSHYLTAVTEFAGQLVQIIDVERIMTDISGMQDEVTDSLMQAFSESNQAIAAHVLVADDSSVARNQIKRTLEQIGIRCTVVQDGLEAWHQLQQWQADGIIVKQHIALLISDIEMPEMDGYTLTAMIRQDPLLQDLRILLHTSMSGAFNDSLVKKVGANQFIAKFAPDELATAVQALLTEWQAEMQQPR